MIHNLHPRHKANNVKFMVLIIFFNILFFSCTTKKIETNNHKYNDIGFACGDIDSLNGDIVIVTPIDSINYLRLNIRGLQTTINSGQFTIDVSAKQESEAHVELLSFLGTKKENLYGYVWDCSDVGTKMVHPDTLSCLKCHIIVRASPSTFTDGLWIRIYQLEVLDALFIADDKYKLISKYTTRPIFFRKGFPG